MKNHHKIVKDILKGMEGIGGIPTNQGFYEEFDFRLRAVLKITIDLSLDDKDIERKFPCGGLRISNDGKFDKPATFDIFANQLRQEGGKWVLNYIKKRL